MYSNTLQDIYDFVEKVAFSSEKEDVDFRVNNGSSGVYHKILDYIKAKDTYDYASDEEFASMPFTHICKSNADYFPTPFTIYAKAKFNSDNTVTVDRYMKFGSVRVGKIIIDTDTFNKYYKECDTK